MLVELCSGSSALPLAKLEAGDPTPRASDKQALLTASVCSGGTGHVTVSYISLA